MPEKLSKAKITYIRTLHTKKGREKAGSFLVEGPKLLAEACAAATHSGFEPEFLAALPDWPEAAYWQAQGIPVYELDEASLGQCSCLQQPNQVLGVFRQRQIQLPPSLPHGLSLGLDRIQDPGNLGTIIRLADWFGIQDLFCQIGTAELYNPKVIQASMGSYLRLRLHYLDLADYLSAQPAHTPIYGAVLDAPSIYTLDLSEAKGQKPAILLIGNESQGLSLALQNQLSQALSIPRYGQAESLNAAMATAILLAYFKQ